MKKLISLLFLCCSIFSSCSNKLFSKLFEAVAKNDISSIKELLDNKADPNLKPQDNAYLLEFAIVTDKIELAQLLLENGANPNLKSQDNAYLLEHAISINKIELAQLLLKHGANPNLKRDENHIYPLERTMSTNNRELARLLLEYGADPNLTSEAFNAAPLFRSLEQRNIQLLNLLLKYNANSTIDKKGPHGSRVSILDYAYTQGCVQSQQAIKATLELAQEKGVKHVFNKYPKLQTLLTSRLICQKNNIVLKYFIKKYPALFNKVKKDKGIENRFKALESYSLYKSTQDFYAQLFRTTHDKTQFSDLNIIAE